MWSPIARRCLETVTVVESSVAEDVNRVALETSVRTRHCDLRCAASTRYGAAHRLALRVRPRDRVPVLALVPLAGYLLPIGIGNCARSGSIRAGFGALDAVAGSAAYFVGWCSGAAVFLLGLALSSALVVGSLLRAYATLAATRRVSLGYVAATG
ncbi:hypothetical protein [Natronococcus jeotgali]|uniref:Uncharacterized protein n=1 Tax=Natronococcus jeotgali DSM 18795 TaxID=1227498 RepID=L9XY41_9EURY|nr:hypothetical protein [Natronococcus jeotgali]ELY66412.1 hypothetical protein C492_00769 [Natronococcus jeotgali DSM 18795]